MGTWLHKSGASLRTSFLCVFFLWNRAPACSRYSLVQILKILPTSSSKSAPNAKRPYYHDPRSHITRTKHRVLHLSVFIREFSRFRTAALPNYLMMGDGHDGVVDMMVEMLTMTIVRSSEVFWLNFLWLFLLTLALMLDVSGENRNWLVWGSAGSVAIWIEGLVEWLEWGPRGSGFILCSFPLFLASSAAGTVSGHGWYWPWRGSPDRSIAGGTTGLAVLGLSSTWVLLELGPLHLQTSKTCIFSGTVWHKKRKSVLKPFAPFASAKVQNCIPKIYWLVSPEKC